MLLAVVFVVPHMRDVTSAFRTRSAKALQRNNVIIKPKTVTHNYCPGISLNFYNLYYSEYTLNWAQLNFTNEKIAPVHYKREAVIAINVYAFIQHQFQGTTPTIFFTHHGSLGYYHNN